MVTVKQVSKDGFAWGHFGTILFHLLIAIALLYLSYRTPSEEKVKRWLFWLGLILCVVSILAMIPIFMYYNKDYKYEIDMR